MDNVHKTQIAAAAANSRNLDEVTHRQNTKRHVLARLQQQVRLYDYKPAVTRQPPLDDLQLALAIQIEYALHRVNSFKQVEDMDE